MHDMDKHLLADAIKKRIARLELILQHETADVPEILQEDNLRDDSARLDYYSQRTIDDTLINLARIELGELQYNLERLLREDAYDCVNCGCEIPVNRALAVPTTRKCVDCAVDTG